MFRSHARRLRGAAAPLTATFLRFVRAETTGGLVLMAATALALVLANSRAAPAFSALWHHRAFAPLGRLGPELTLHGLIDDGLMAVFFLLVGLEIKRELIVGELASLRRAALPAVAALGGMVAPALVYLLFARGSDATAGWGIPTATDIAFTVGVMVLLGRRVPAWIKVFVTALAIVDDLGAVLLIALFYTSAPSLPALALSGGATAVLLLLNRLGVQRLLPYLVVGVLLWGAMLASGVHATLAGVVLGMCVPLRGRPSESGEDAEAPSPLHRLEHALQLPVAMVILPLFALANAGVALPLSRGPLVAALHAPAPQGVFFGLVVGKPLGIWAASFLAVRLGIGELPARGRFVQLLGAAMLAGIGFTMSIFIAGLAFPDEARLSAAKLGILAGSLVSALAGAAFLGLVTPKDAAG